jgi:hypothetical protein
MSGDFRHLLRERWQINWQTISAIAKILGVLVSVVVLSYPFGHVSKYRLYQMT